MAAIEAFGRFRLVVPDGEARARDAFLAAAASGWLAYTYLYPALGGLHATLPACPFLAVTGHPCPFCGATRSTSALWRGDLGSSLHLYPLGPLLFVTCFAVGAYALVALGTRRSLVLHLPRRVEMAITVLGIGLLSTSWAMKLAWLGN